MGLWSMMTGAFHRRTDQKNSSNWPQELIDYLSGGRSTASGETVNWKTALESPTALRSGLLIADGISTVPCKLMRKNPDTGRREEATEHPVFDLLKYKPCGWMTSQQFRETMMLRAVFSGQSFAFINWIDNNRKISEIWPFDIGEVTSAKRQDSRDRSPLYRVNGEEVPARNILHIRGPSWDARNGLDMVSLAREALGLAVATEKAHAGRFGNGIQTTGTYSVEGSLSDVQYKQLMHFIVQHYAGGANAGKPLLLDRNAKWTPQGMSGVDAEHLATRQHQDMLIARFFGVLPIMLGIADKTATYASSEQMFLAHCVHTVRPWHQRISEILNCWLLTPQDRANGYYFHFVDTALLRGAAKDRAEFYAKLFGVAGITPNQILAFEDMDGFEGGDSHYVPANYARVDGTGDLQMPASVTTAVAELIGVKGGPLNIGRVLSGKNEGLIRGAHDDLGTVLAQLAEQPEE